MFIPTSPSAPVEFFEKVGMSVEDILANFAEESSSALISIIAPIIFVCVILYMTLRGWMILTGRAEGAIPDTVISCFKISIIAFFGLNAGNFIGIVIPAVNDVEHIFSQAISGNDNAWSSLDELWEKSSYTATKLFEFLGNFGVFDGFLIALCIFLLIVLFKLGTVILIMLAFAMLLLAKMCIIIALGFGPFFICTLMFPLTRSWFDGWLKTVLNYVFTAIIVVALLTLINNLLDPILQELTDFFNQYSIDPDDIEEQGGFNLLLDVVLFFVLIAFAAAFLFKTLPSMVASLIGGISISTISLPGFQSIQGLIPSSKGNAPSNVPLQNTLPSSISPAGLNFGMSRADRALSSALASSRQDALPAPPSIFALGNTSKPSLPYFK